MGDQISFRPNQNTFVADLVTNYSNSSYHAMQLEVRRRASEGVQFQAELLVLEGADRLERDRSPI